MLVTGLSGSGFGYSSSAKELKVPSRDKLFFVRETTQGSDTSDGDGSNCARAGSVHFKILEVNDFKPEAAYGGGMLWFQGVAWIRFFA